MDLSKVGEKILSSVRSARSLGLLPSASSDRPEVPQRVAAAAAVARALAGLPADQRLSLPSSSRELSSIYGSRPCPVVEELEKEFYEEDFDPVKHILENAPSDESELAYFEKQAALRLAQLDRVSEQLSCQVMEHHEVMVKGMNLVRELERDLKIANVICMNGRRCLNSSMNEVSRDLIVNSNSKRKQALLDVLPVLTELCHAQEMQSKLESLVDERNYCKAFQVLSEYLQLLDSLSDLSAAKEMSQSVEAWLERTLHKLDSQLLGVCQQFKEQGYLTVLDAYALIGDISGLAEKIQSSFMQEVISETHAVLKSVVQEDECATTQNSRLTYSDLCLQTPESKFRLCLLRTLAALFQLMCSYHCIMSFQPETGVPECQTSDSNQVDGVISTSDSLEETPIVSSPEGAATNCSTHQKSSDAEEVAGNGSDEASGSESPWYHLRKEAAAFVSSTLQRGRRNLWQLTTSRISVLLSSPAASSTSIHQFLKNYEDLNVFILAGEAFCGVEAVEFREKLKGVCENYFIAFHRQSVHALKMVLQKETWMKLPPDTVEVINFAGLVGDGAPLIGSSRGSTTTKTLHTMRSNNVAGTGIKKSGFSYWLKSGNLFSVKLASSPRGGEGYSMENGAFYGDHKENKNSHAEFTYPQRSDGKSMNGTPVSEDENEDLLADFIDEDSQLPSRVSKSHFRNRSRHWNNDDFTAQTGSSLCLLRSMDKYARLMQKLEIVNAEFFKGICQLFQIFFYFVFETFGHENNGSSGKGSLDFINYRLKTAISRISPDCDHWIKTQLTSSSSSLTTHGDSSTSFGHSSGTSFGLKERCAAVENLSLVARILHRSKQHLQSMLRQNNAALVEDFYGQLVDSIPDLIEHIHRTTARILLHINGYVDRIANAKWELKELGMEHNGYVDLMLGEFKHYKTRLAHGGISKEVQDLLLEYGVEIIAETLVEGLSRVKRCTDEGRALMSLDLQVLINGLQHFVSINVKPKLQVVETFIKAYYLPETEYVHWARSHAEYSKSQVVGLVNLVATMKGWKRKSRLEVIEKIESASI